MVKNRRDFLDKKLREVLKEHCYALYYNSTSNTKITYPCVIYKLSDKQSRFADDVMYFHRDIYQVTVISKLPDSPVVEDIMEKFQNVTFDSNYVIDNLYHSILTITQSY